MILRAKNAYAILATLPIVCFLLMFAKPMFAQVPPPYVECDKTDYPEFQSLRPYQKSPCKLKATELAQFCGNDLSIGESVSSSQSTSPNSASNCKLVGGGKYKCTYKETGIHKYYNIDVKDIQVPILGNTEEVINSQQQDAELDDAQKMNDYVSWYLNGVNGRAEYNPLLENDTDIRKIIDFSGPIKKLLPQQIQNDARIKQIEKAEVPEERHNQVVGCIYGASIPITNPFTGDRITVGGFPTNCYGNQASGPIGSIINWVAGIAKKEIMLSEYKEKQYQPPKITDFPDFQEYLIAYERWRGKSCGMFTIYVPIIGEQKIVLCFDNILKPNFYAKLFQNIPLTSTEDRKGLLNVSSNLIADDPNVKIDNVVIISEPAPLFISHTEEVTELASQLQVTFVPYGKSGQGAATNTTDPPENEGCTLLNVRTNKGDETFPGALEIDLTYDVEYSCNFDAFELGTCKKNLTLALGTFTETPKAEEIWERLVAGPAAIFKKIFPKIGKGTEFGAILDIPGSSKVTYTGDVNQSAEVYFPHLGGLDEYLLTGIQTLLRPKGYGEQISWGSPDDLTSCGTGLKKLNPPSGTTSKASSYFSKYIKPKLNDKLMDIYAQAEKKTGVPCEVLAGVHHMEGSNNMNQSLQNGGALSGSLLQSAIQAGNEIKAKVGGNIKDWNSLIKALSYYNGGGNRNCGRGVGYTGPCPPPIGIDDPYPMAWLDSQHLNMWLIYCADYTQCSPFPPFERPGALAVAIEVMKSSK
jgi:hypothetical protein